MNLSSIGPILLREVDQLAREKFLTKEAVFASLEDAFQKVCSESYGPANDIRVNIDRRDGKILIQRHRTVVSEIADPFREVDFQEVQGAGLKLGEELVEALPLLDFNRVDVQNVKQILVNNIQSIEREAQYSEFKDRVDQIVSGTVKRIEGTSLIVDLGRAEGVLLRDDLIPRENYRIGDRVKSYIYSVRHEVKGPQIFLSRTHPKFVAKLFAQEVPEIYDGLIEIKAVARDPGSRAKVAIMSREGKDRSFDPVGACVGVRGNRVNAISQEIFGERIDIVLWSPELPTFVVNALTPAEVSKVIVNHTSAKSLTVVVLDNQQSIAIGRRGQNVRLAHQLTGADIEITTESVETARSQQERQNRVQLFQEHLDLDEFMAHFLVTEGFESIQDILDVPVEELASMQGFTLEIAEELHQRSREGLAVSTQRVVQKFLAEGGEQVLVDLSKTPELLPVFQKHKILTVQNLADLSLEDLKEIIPSGSVFSDEELARWIMEARRLLQAPGRELSE